MTNKQNYWHQRFVQMWTHSCIRNEIMKLQPSIWCYVLLWPISESRQATIHLTTHANTEHKIVHGLLAWKNRLHAYTKQCTESYMNVYLCIFFLQIIIHIQAVTKTDEVGWVMEGNICTQDYTYLLKNKLSIKDRIFYTS
jgi:hypothetical protein